jgi:hypothetical protein
MYKLRRAILSRAMRTQAKNNADADVASPKKSAAPVYQLHCAILSQA